MSFSIFRFPEPKPLSDATLAQHRGRVRVPTYDRRTLGAGVAHIGVGGFHRAHQAAYLDDIAESGISSEWGVLGVCLRRPVTTNRLAAQDHLYTLVERSHEGDEARIVGSVRGSFFGPADPGAAVWALARPQTKLVTLTITGDGYKPAKPGSSNRAGTFDYICRALEERFRRGVAPFTVLSCDNLPGNGDAAREATIRATTDPRFARWIEQNVCFPNSVVDRITPEPTDDTHRLVERHFGIDDQAPITAEPFSLWVIEDSFSNERPPLDSVGAQFVDDVEDFAVAKRRMLNGGHSALAYLGLLLGHRTTDAAMNDPVVGRFMDRLLAWEIAPLLDEPDGLSLDEFRQTLLERFANPALGDRLERLARRGSTKMPAYLLPSIEDARAVGASIELLALSVAAWFRYLQGGDLRGMEIEVDDPMADELVPLAREGGDDPRCLLSHREVFGDLGEDPDVVDAIRQALESIRTVGLSETVARCTDSSQPAIAA